MTDNQETWQMISTITTARNYEGRIREIIAGSLEGDDLTIKSLECSHPRMTDTAFIQLVLVAETQDFETADIFGMRIKTLVSRLGEASTTVTEKKS